MLTRVDPSLDRAVVLFQDVIQVRHRPVQTVFVQSAFSFEPHDRRRVRAVTVGVDDARHGKRSATAASRLAESKKSIVAPLESTTRYKYTHLPLTRM